MMCLAVETKRVWSLIMGEVDMSQTGQGSNGSVLDFLSRHRSALVWLAVLVLIVWMQWPMLKGTFYRVLKVPPPADGIAWRTGFDAALAEAARDGKPVLLGFTAGWCPPCQVMKHDVWPTPEVREAVTAGYVPVLLDVDDPANHPVAQRYSVSSIPSIVIVAPDGSVLRKGGFMSKRAMLAFLKSPG